MTLELVTMRIERFVELRRPAWLSTPILWPTKDITPLSVPTPGPPVGGMNGGDKGFGTEMLPFDDDRGADVNTSGIKWKYASQGPSVLRPARPGSDPPPKAYVGPVMLIRVVTGSMLQEASSRHRADAVFARKSYIDSVVYMLKALPEDMDEIERAAVRRAAADSCGERESGDGEGEGADRSFLRRWVQSLVALVVLLAHALFRLFREGVRLGARYEREHHVSQALVELGLFAAGAVGRYGAVLGAAVNAAGDSPAGRAVGALAAWALENVVAGIQDGLGEGMQTANRRP
ncbi:hypothetical protein DL764_000775 [Monosporascus ibericus]|uniref:Uncharacterized protein n=1 Tax=Monosporascus ibericus TaxID=155417 RepID=A0A4Q4TXD8_9PEZI|nr:hypothetical protein DL764_000775 [Monosporascus ibericus]